MKIGAFVGKFLPPHLGHISVIDRMINECDECVIVISDNPRESKKMCENANFPYFNSEKRLNWLKKHYSKYKNVHYALIDESDISKENYMEAYSKKFWESVPYQVNVKYADESYRELNERYFQTCTFVPINRDIINIHGTDIRQNLEKNKEYIIKEAREDIIKKIKSKKYRSNYGKI